MSGQIRIVARVASVTDIEGDDTQKAITFDLNLDPDMPDQGFAFAVNLHTDAVEGLEPGTPVSITIEPA